MRSAPRVTTRSPSGHAGGNNHTGGVEWLCAHRPRLESLSLDVQPYDRFAIAAAHHAIPWNDDAGDGRSALGHNGDRLADAEVRRRLRDGEVLQGSGIVPVVGKLIPARMPQHVRMQ
jgi:hypothetical protein